MTKSIDESIIRKAHAAYMADEAATLKSIGKEFGVSPTALQMRWARYGLPRRTGRGGQSVVKHMDADTLRRAHAEYMADNTATLKTAAAKLNCSSPFLSNKWKELGLRPKSRAHNKREGAAKGGRPRKPEPTPMWESVLRHTDLKELRPGRVGLYVNGGCYKTYDGPTTEVAMEQGRRHVRRLVRTVTEQNERKYSPTDAARQARQEGGRKGGKARRV